jgi:hypothetical protein
LAPPTIAITGRAGFSERLVERRKLRLHGTPGTGRQHMGQALGRSVSPVRRRESVVDIDIAQRRQGSDKGRVVLLLAGMEACVLETQHIAGLHRSPRPQPPPSRCNLAANATG